MHFCSDATYDERFWRSFPPDFRFYYECLMAPNAPLGALRHEAHGQAARRYRWWLPPTGPLLRYNVTELTERYRTWSPGEGQGGNPWWRCFTCQITGLAIAFPRPLPTASPKTDVAVESDGILRSADPPRSHRVGEGFGAKGLVIGICPPLLRFNWSQGNPGQPWAPSWPPCNV